MWSTRSDDTLEARAVSCVVSWESWRLHGLFQPAQIHRVAAVSREGVEGGTVANPAGPMASDEDSETLLIFRRNLNVFSRALPRTWR